MVMMAMMVMMVIVMMVGGYGSEWCMRRKEEWKRQRDVGGIYVHWFIHFQKKKKVMKSE